MGTPRNYAKPGQKPKRFAVVPYLEYLKSDIWAKRRRIALTHAENKCRLCNSGTDLDVHHRTYERLGSELDSDLTVLCRRCHTLFHANLAVVESDAALKRRLIEAYCDGELSAEQISKWFQYNNLQDA